MMPRPRRLLRMPLLHFLAGGALLFALARIALPAHAPAPPIVVSADDVAHLRDTYARETGLQPTAADEAALVESAIQEELLFREAVARGLDRNDRSVRNWLIEQMRILTDDVTSGDDVLYARARALELDRKDLVVRRILVQKMRLLASRLGEAEVGDDQLRAYYEQHRADYQLPERVSLWHVFFASQRWGDGTRQQAATVLADLGERPADAGVAPRGDAFPVSAHLTRQSQAQLAKLFGTAFAEAVMRAASQRWIGPVESSYGVHLVWIEAQERGAPAPFESVRGQVLERWHEERRAQRVAQLIHELERRSALQVDSAAWRQRRGV